MRELFNAPKTISLGELRAELAWTKDLPDETLVSFGAGDLTFLRSKNRAGDGWNLVHIEFAEQYVISHPAPAGD